MWLDTVLTLLLLALALLLRPWRMLGAQRPLAHESHGAPCALWTPLLACLVFLPWLWALPTLTRMPLQLQWSGACLVLLMLGWPLAVPVLCAVGAIACLLSPALDAPAALSMTLWHGLVPATFALAWGALLRRLLGTRVFVREAAIVAIKKACFRQTAKNLSVAAPSARLARLQRWPALCSVARNLSLQR